MIVKTQGSHSTADEDSSLPVYGSVQSLELLCTMLKMETVCSSETLSSINQSECHIPEDLYHQGYIQSRTNDVTALTRWRCSAFWQHVSLSPDQYALRKTEKISTNAKCQYRQTRVTWWQICRIHHQNSASVVHTAMFNTEKLYLDYIQNLDNTKVTEWPKCSQSNVDHTSGKSTMSHERLDNHWHPSPPVWCQNMQTSDLTSCKP